MRSDEFFEHHTEPDEYGLGFGTKVSSRFRHEFVRSLRAGSQTMPDVEAAVALARLIHEELELFGSGGGEHLNDSDMREALLAFHAVLKRLGVRSPDTQFRDFTTFRNWWLREGASGSYQARRDLLDGVFGAVHDQLADLETNALAGTLVDAVSPRGRVGWARIDEEISELRRHFAQSRTPQDHRNVGNDCTIVIEALSQQVYDVKRHLRDGETEPPVGNTKQRLERFVEDAASGPGNVELRKLARATIEMAQAVKHNPTPDRRSAGIAADTTILLANLLRRLEDS